MGVEGLFRIVNGSRLLKMWMPRASGFSNWSQGGGGGWGVKSQQMKWVFTIRREDKSGRLFLEELARCWE